MSWEELIAIRDEARQVVADDQAAPIIDCPTCGEVLDENGRGEVNCPMGHFRQQGRRRGVES